MNYDFDVLTDRRKTHCLKWEVGEQELPMWVADMDFPAAPRIREAILARAQHGIFGYSTIPEAWQEAYVGWWRRRHHFVMEKEWLIFCTGVIPAISSMIRGLTAAGENVLVQTPVYNMFFNSITDNDRQVLENPLTYDGEVYGMDLEDLERKLADPKTTLMILCNPQNPSGRIWNREELAQIGELCRTYQVTVIADEIHCDLTSPGWEYIPFASVSESCRKVSITCLAPTKAFNLAGIQTAAVSVPDPDLRHKVRQGLNTSGAAEPNFFAVEAAVAAFTEGEAWLDALREYIQENREYAEEFFQKEIPRIRSVPSKATYLLWLDCSRMQGCTSEFAGYLREHTGLYLSKGIQYGENGSSFLRMNIACPRSRLRDGLERLDRGAAAYEVRVLTDT